jgi:nucleotide-binding universal stress UspA family protein
MYYAQSKERETMSTHSPSEAVALPVQLISEEPTSAALQVQNILCPVDFSEFSLRAFTYATCLARYFRARLFLQHTVHVPYSAYPGFAEAAETRGTLQAKLNRAGAGMRRLAAVARLELPDMVMLANEGDVRDRILQSIEEHRIDLVVMGTHGRKGFNRLVAGSVAEHIVHQAVCPVLVVCRPRRDFIVPDEWEPIRLETILLATDFSPNSGRALAYALKWASEWAGKVILFHAVEEIPSAMEGRVDLFPEYNPYFEKQLAEAWQTIQRQVPAAANRGCEISYEVRHGNAKEEILRVAEERNAGLIVMGAQGLERSAVTWGSTISAVVRDGRFPVLALRHLPF